MIIDAISCDSSERKRKTCASQFPPFPKKYLALPEISCWSSGATVMASQSNVAARPDIAQKKINIKDAPSQPAPAKAYGMAVTPAPQALLKMRQKPPKKLIPRETRIAVVES